MYISRRVTWVFLNVVVCTKNRLICKGNHGYLLLCPSINTKLGHVSENPIDYPEKRIEKFEKYQKVIYYEIHWAAWLVTRSS